MTPETWQRVKAVFDAALSLPPPERPGFLDSACGADGALRTEVESLLSAAAGNKSFLGTPAPTVTSPIDQPRSVIGPGQMIGRYRVLSHLGAGGMGEVYLAEDPRLGRRIALKLLPRQLSYDPARLQRFEREARAASQLAHPNVCVIHEIEDTADERRFIAMEYVEGESLRQVLERHRAAGTRLPLDEALDIARQVAAGLGAAHTAGIVHRDVKPENLMRRPDGLMKVLDFGLAKLVEPLAGSGGTGSSSAQTEAGTVLGTVLYMSPEQARALPLDARTDVWSLAVVLYEMLAGQPPFEGKTAADVIVSILDREPPPLATLAAGLPEGIHRVLGRALQKEREARYSSMGELASDLKNVREGMDEHAWHPHEALRSGVKPPPRAFRGWRVALAAALGVSVLIGGAFAFGWRRAHRVVRLAVLPFDNIGDSADAYFTDGMTDAVRGKLTELGIQVTTSLSSNQYRATTKSVQQVGQELGVQYLLRGTVRWQRGEAATSRVQVNPELIQATSASTLWQQPMRRALTLTDVFELQDEIALRVAQALDVALSDSARQHLTQRPTQNPAAYDAYLRGQEVQWSGNINDPPTLRKAIVYYRQAVALDSSYVEAWLRLSMANSFLYDNTAHTPAMSEEARRAAERALALAPDRAEGHRAMAVYYTQVTRVYDSALVELAQSRKLAPNNLEVQSTSLNHAAYLERILGRWDSALVHFQEAHSTEPHRVTPLENLALVQLWLRHYPEARNAADLALAIAPENLNMIQKKAMIALAEGDLPGARAVLATTPKEVDSADVVVWMARYLELMWVLDDAQQRILLRLRPEAFDDDIGDWGLALAQTLWLRGEQARARTYADSARIAFEEYLRDEPEEAYYHAVHGLALAYLGRRTEAVQAGRRAVAMMPISKNAEDGPYFQHQLARIYILIGEQELALDQLESLLRIPYYLSPSWLKIDPNFSSLRTNPRFQRLVAGSL